jgi:MFS family permease
MYQINFDDILVSRVGLGRAQFESLAVLSMIDFIDGFQDLLNSILTKIMTLQFALNEWQESLFASIYFIGIVIGNAICAFLSDRLGRRILLLWGTFITFLALLLYSFAQNYAELLCFRLLLGIVLGVTLPISLITVAEIIPCNVRGRFVVLL